MKHIKLTIYLSIGCILLLSFIMVHARPDYYTSAFYTRGIESAYNMDRGDNYEPFYVPVDKWALLPRLSLAYSQSDNYYLSESNEISSATLTLVPGAMLVYGRPEHNHVYIDTGMQIPVYEKEELLENGNAYMLMLGGVYKTGRSRLSLRAGHRRQERSDWALGERIVLRDITVNADYEYRLSMKSDIGAAAMVGVYDYDRDEYINYNRYYGRVRYAHRLTERSDWYIEPGLGRDELDRSEQGVYSDADFAELSLGLRGRLTPKTTASGSVGYRWREYDDSSIRDTSKWIANYYMDYSPGGLSVFSLDAIADLRPDVTGQAGAVWDRRLTLGVNRRLLVESLRGSASFLVGDIDYIDNSFAADETYWGYRLGIDWWLKSDLSVGVAYSYNERDSSLNEDTDYDQWSFRMSWNY